MKKLLLTAMLFFFTMFGAGYASATIMISLDTQPPTIDPPANLLVNIAISGLHSGGADSYLGAFQMDVHYDPSIFTFLTSGGSLGLALGDEQMGESIFGIDYLSDPGIVHFSEVSLLPIADLVSRQSNLLPLDGFSLGTLAFYAYGSGGLTSTDISATNIVLGDANGDPLPTPNNALVRVNIPEPQSIFLLGVGLVGMRLSRRKQF